MSFIKVFDVLFFTQKVYKKEYFIKTMKCLKQYLNAFNEGLQTHSKAYTIMRKYEEPCKEASIQLREAGITIENWMRLNLGSDLSLEGIMYSMGGLVSWCKSEMPK